MSWPVREKIEEGVLSMLRVNMGLKEGERLLVVTDPPDLSLWQDKSPAELTSQLERSMLARMVAEIAKESFPHSTVDFFPYPSVRMHGKEPGEALAEKLLQAEVIVAITNYSLSHTRARAKATEAGARIASMPGFVARMFHPDGPMAVDYHQVGADTERLAALITASESGVVHSPAGTDIRCSLAGRSGGVDSGLCSERAAWSNLPAGEAYVAPVEGTAEGVIVVQTGWYPHLTEEMVLHLEQGLVVRLEGGGKVGDEFRELLQLEREEETYRARRNLAELGIGTNPNARQPDNVLEAEKIKGTVHLAIGDNSHMGGTVTSDLHEDFVIPEPDLLLDGNLVIEGGEWRI
ncbi:MAG: aminopeptidase [Anaerolineae bacterium]|nr:aminopeptidase [Anaerolineae bacterium]NIN96054.1 aminopeptidase [Anaerolineae bacterium]NIQ79084.1 aminopeptidase [Anaerolineae bacterium]